MGPPFHQGGNRLRVTFPRFRLFFKRRSASSAAPYAKLQILFGERWLLRSFHGFFSFFRLCFVRLLPGNLVGNIFFFFLFFNENSVREYL